MAREINFIVQWDEEVRLWWAECSGEEGIVTEAKTIEALRSRLKLIVPDYLEIDDEDITINLDIHVSDTVPAQNRVAHG